VPAQAPGRPARWLAVPEQVKEPEQQEAPALRQEACPARVEVVCFRAQLEPAAAAQA
jgi:hypothetical protein